MSEYETVLLVIIETPRPRPREDPKSRSLLGLYNLQNRIIRIQSCGFYFLDPHRALHPGLQPAAKYRSPDNYLHYFQARSPRAVLEYGTRL